MRTDFNLFSVVQNSPSIGVIWCFQRGSLQDKIESLSKRSEKMAESEIWHVFLGVCRGVSAMHNHDPPYAHR